ncbi:Protein DSE1 [Candida viswanathii]|uniref:Protein DSE1 n=1 Tax=Candida viswanathii TaxID=5486 RepID=A0A367XN16_9ASCO|nr:Protein DSE1 [Candida viswanathii]
MPEYYEPTLLFRQNAIKRFSPSLSPISSVESLSLADANSSFYQNSNSSWLLNNYNPKDTAILNQSCSLNRTNIKSNYWKIPDQSMNLTSMCINSNHGANPIMAISSGRADSNLYVYELNLYNNHLIHHHTITLPNIYAMKWINNTRYLVTGNNKGYAHLVSTPKLATRDVFNGDNGQGYDDDDEAGNSAEIYKRFNHRKHLKDKQWADDIAGASPIRHLNFLNNYENLLSIYNDYLFYWDINNCEQQTRPSPVTITNVAGIKNFDVLQEETSSTVAICGRFGVSLFDLRDCKFNIPGHPDQTQSFKRMSADLIKWNPCNTNILAAGHGDGVVRLWDIRKQESRVAELDGHKNYNVTSIEWSDNDLYTGGRDGNIIHWDLSSDVSLDDLSSGQSVSCGLKDGFDSVQFNGKANALEAKLNQRQCGTVLPASNSNIVAMCSIRCDEEADTKIMSIDGSAFLGVHNKISESFNVNLSTNKLYYTEEDIQLLLQSELNNNSAVSHDTLVGEFQNYSAESLVKPLTITRKPTPITRPIPVPVPSPLPSPTPNATKPSHSPSNSISSSVVSIHNHSNDTLVNSPNKVVVTGFESDDEFTFNAMPKAERYSSFSSVSSHRSQANNSTESLSTNATEVGSDSPHHFQKLVPPIGDTTNNNDTPMVSV